MENNQSFLFILDHSVDIKLLNNIKGISPVDNVTFFPLTGDVSFVDAVKHVLMKQGVASFSQYNTALLFDNEVKELREKVKKWSAQTGNYMALGKTVKEWFLLPYCNVSTWWYSLLSGKNTLKTDAFFRIAQVRAAKMALSEKSFDGILVFVADKSLRRSVKNLAAKFNIPIIILKTAHQTGIQFKIRSFLNKTSFYRSVCLGFFYLARFAWRGFLARHYLGNRKLRVPDRDSLLFVTYFPSVEKDALQKKLFKNKYAPVLQDKLKEMSIPVVWLLMYVPINGYDFGKAVRLAKHFADNGEKLFLAEEYFTLKTIILTFFLWVRQLIIGIFVYCSIKKKNLFSDSLENEYEPIIKSMWGQSFYGPFGMEGIIYSFIFQKVFREITNIFNCLYYCEMQAWEKALNAGKKGNNPSVTTIGYQHSSVSRNFYYYFFDSLETARTGKDTDLPLPDILACNGEITGSMFEKSGYKMVTRVEAVRYLYLNQILSGHIQLNKKKPVLLVAGSINKMETLNLVMFVKSAFPAAQEFEIWFKGHPGMLMETIFLELNIKSGREGYKIIHDDIAECLGHARVAIVPSSTVAIEAIAFGCEVIIPVFPDMMTMNPLSDFEGYCHKVASPEEMSNTVRKILSGYAMKHIDEYREFVKSYWDLDPSLKRWTKLLTSQIDLRCNNRQFHHGRDG
jgi:surface carbohydrate biosynthesis protein (TIGR04326 family)